MPLTRRDFLHVCGAMSLASLGYADPGGTHGDDCLLLEARSFSDLGGWLVDCQFEDIMGFPYLLAHGCGRPVRSASTTAAFPSTGPYHLWVRTRNWCPGPWEAPGRFRITVAGRELPTVFGTEPGWAWQRGGRVEITQARTDLALVDLTGFDGRVDALFFTKDSAFTPPAEVEPMQKWRRSIMGIPDVPVRRESFDVVVVGGGFAGCGAAIAAARAGAGAGMKVALIHDRPVLGGNSSSEVGVPPIGVAGPSRGIINAMDTASHSASQLTFFAEEGEANRLAMITAEPNIRLFLDWRLYDVQVTAGRISSCDAHHNRTGEAVRFDAPLFIDCSGDAWLGFRAGAEFRQGREAKSEFDEGWDEFKEKWSPTNPDRLTMGSNLKYRTGPAASPEDAAFPEVPWAMPIAKDHAAAEAEWNSEYAREDLDQIRDGEEIRDHLLRWIYGSFANARKNPKHAMLKITFVGYVLGRRESRRLMGDHIYSMKDMTENRLFPDAVVEEPRQLDMHAQLGGNLSVGSMAMEMKVGTYFVPFRSLYSRTITNLMMAGRCFSCTHIGLSGPRCQKTTGQMGIATGYAAALCTKHACTPRELAQKHIAELRRLIGITVGSPSDPPAPKSPGKPQRQP